MFADMQGQDARETLHRLMTQHKHARSKAAAARLSAVKRERHARGSGRRELHERKALADVGLSIADHAHGRHARGGACERCSGAAGRAARGRAAHAAERADDLLVLRGVSGLTRALLASGRLQGLAGARPRTGGARAAPARRTAGCRRKWSAQGRRAPRQGRPRRGCPSRRPRRSPHCSPRAAWLPGPRAGAGRPAGPPPCSFSLATTTIR